MTKELFLADLSRFENQIVTGFFSVTSRQVRASRNGGSGYVAVTLGDRTGQTEARIWELENDGDFASGDIVKVRGQVCRYQDKLQIKIEKIRRASTELDGDVYALGDFVPTTQFDVEAMWVKLVGYVESFTEPHLRALLERILAEPGMARDLREAPAAKAMHHAWIGGLLEHIVSLCDLCDMTSRHYPEIHRDLLLTGAILHDIGKLEELRWGTSFGYTTEGQLLGHISIGAGFVERTVAAMPDFPPALRTLVLHMVLSHHGRYEYGSPKLPMTAEAILLNFLDDLDAKMQTVRSELGRAVANGAAPGEPTEWIRALERPLVDTHAYLASEPKEKS